MKAKAFTLVELLVVIAIIALLMAILMPALQRARMQAKHVICKANLKTYGLVMTMYISDYDDRLPESFTGLYSLATIQANGPNPGDLVGIPPDGTYIPYLKKNVKSSICGVFADVYHQKHSDKPKPVFTYSFNWWLNADKPIIPRVSMVRASQTFFAAEEGVWQMNDENGRVNGSTMNDNSLCTRWEGGMSLKRVKEFTVSDFPPDPNPTWPYTDAFGEYHRIPLRKIYSAMARKELTGGVSVAVLVDGSVTDVTPYDTFRYAVGGL